MADEVNLHETLRELVDDYARRTGVRINAIEIAWCVSRTVGGPPLNIVVGVHVETESL